MASGEFVDGVRCEDLRNLTLADANVDIVVTQDVFEHVINPAKAFREIARVLRPGGLHVFTVPIFPLPHTVIRVDDEGRQLMPPDYHESPIGDGQSVVVREWGDDILEFIGDSSGMTTRRYDVTNWRLGLRGEMKDVLVSRR